MLGVVPCSTRSADEASGLMRAAMPQAVYIDVAPEMLAVLQDQVKAGQIGDALRVTEVTPSYRFGMYPGVGPLVTIALRNAVADNEMASLLGCEIFAPYKSALVVAAQESQAPNIFSYPYPMSYKNADTIDRPNHIGLHVAGNMSFQSTDLKAFVGNQTLLIAGDACETEFSVALPQVGYFTRAQVNQLQQDFRAAVNKFAAAANAESCDAESTFSAKEAAALASGDAVTSELFRRPALLSQHQSQAIAHVLQEKADELGPGSSTVAIVNIGSLASLKRNWAESQSPAVVMPQASPLVQALGYTGPTVICGGLGYLTYRGFRRFPRATGAATLLIGGTFVTAFSIGIYGDNVKYGSQLRSALSRPRVTAPLTRH